MDPDDLLKRIEALKLIPDLGEKLSVDNGLMSGTAAEKKLILVAKFVDETDMKRALNDGPWNFFQDLIVFRRPTGLEAFHSVVFKQVAFWIQLHNLPIVFYNETMLREIGNKIGKVLKIQGAEEDSLLGNFARLRVSIDINQPLKQAVCVHTPEAEDEIFILVFYEKLPDFCFLCGRLGHNNRACKFEEANDSKNLFGAWLRAPTFSPRRKNSPKKSAPGSENVDQEKESSKSGAADLPRDIIPMEEDETNRHITNIEESLTEKGKEFRTYRDDHTTPGRGNEIQPVGANPSLQKSSLVITATKSTDVTYDINEEGKSMKRGTRNWKQLARGIVGIMDVNENRMRDLVGKKRLGCHIDEDQDHEEDRVTTLLFTVYCKCTDYRNIW